MIKIHKVFVDLKNYYTLRKIIKNEVKNSPVWAKMNLRVDWIGRIYTVYNLPHEVTESRDVPKDAYIAYVIEQAKPLNEYLTGLNLQEILVPRYTEIDGTNSFLLMYLPFFQELSWRWFFTRTTFWLLIFWCQHKFHLFTTMYSWIHQHLF